MSSLRVMFRDILVEFDLSFQEGDEVNDRPLADRMRPESAADLSGQDKIWGPNSRLLRLAETGNFHGLIFWGPPGSGKTSLARLIAKMGSREVCHLSAVSTSSKVLRAVIDSSRQKTSQGQSNLLVFLDEIHRLNKAQQDILLPALEGGVIKLIGATTENPSFEVNKAVLSRCLVFAFTAISPESLLSILERSVAKKFWSAEVMTVPRPVLESIARHADGDARRALTLLEALMMSLPAEQGQVSEHDLELLGVDQRSRFDRQGEQHYDIVSALIKSIRGSHPDAALYYLARMIDGGEDPMFLARRLLIAASEDIGNANPTALLVATAGMQAVHMVGYPEARIILSQVTTYLSASPKSNRSYLGIDKALAEVKQSGSLDIPFGLRNAPTAFMKQQGYGQGYVYAHDDPAGARQMRYLPDQLRGRKFYEPSASGVEATLAQNLEKIRPSAD